MSWSRQWELRDPAIVYERKQQQAQQSAKRELERIFRDDMGRTVQIPPHITAAMFKWGQWARRPQFWANLGITPFCRLVGIGVSRDRPEIALDPQSMAIHKQVVRLRDRKMQAVLVGYYVAEFNWDAKPAIYQGEHISRRAFYDLLKAGSVSVFNAARL